MNNLIMFPGVGTWKYNSDRLHRYAGSMMEQGRWAEFECVMAVQELYDNELVNIRWDPSTGEPVVVKKGGTEIAISTEEKKDDLQGSETNRFERKE